MKSPREAPFNCDTAECQNRAETYIYIYILIRMRTYACTHIQRNVSTIPLACTDMTPLGIHILHNNSNEMQGPGANYRTGDDLRATTFRNKHPMRGYPQEVLLGFTRAPNTIAHGCRLISYCFFGFYMRRYKDVYQYVAGASAISLLQAEENRPPVCKVGNDQICEGRLKRAEDK